MAHICALWACTGILCGWAALLRACCECITVPRERPALVVTLKHWCPARNRETGQDNPSQQGVSSTASVLAVDEKGVSQLCAAAAGACAQTNSIATNLSATACSEAAGFKRGTRSSAHSDKAAKTAITTTTQRVVARWRTTLQTLSSPESKARQS